MKKFFTAAFFAAIFLQGVSFAEIKMPRVFSDGAVLQCGKPLKIWGEAAPDSTVEVAFGGCSATAKADSSGEWSVQLPPFEASKNPREMTVSENGKISKTVSDILVGEVWVLGGQSNMAWPLKPTKDCVKAIQRADYPTIRCFRSSKQLLSDVYAGKKFGTFERSSLCSLSLARTPQKDSPEGSAWERATPQNVPLWSAIGFHFAEKLAADLDVPVGLLFTPLGGSPMIAWIPESAADGNAVMKARAKSFRKLLRAWDNGGYEKAKTEYDAKIAKLVADKGKIDRSGGYRDYVPPSKDSPYAESSTPFFNYNAKVAPLSGYAVRGILWYQGESDAYKATEEKFGGQLGLVIDVWRKCFGDAKLPFLQVQLSSYGRSACWPEVRAAQLAASRDIENVYTVCSIDAGDKKDVHPRDKETVATRLEKMAVSQVYGKKIPAPFSPVFKGAEFGGARVLVSVDDFGRGLKTDGKLRGFEVLCGGKWVAANAEIDGGKIAVQSPDSSRADGVRYLWCQYPQDDVCVRNSDGLPLFPFKAERKK